MTLARFIFLVPIKNTGILRIQIPVSGGVYQQLVGISYSLSFSWNESVGIPDNERIVGLNVSVPFNVLTKRRYTRENALDRAYASLTPTVTATGKIAGWQALVGPYWKATT